MEATTNIKIKKTRMKGAKMNVFAAILLVILFAYMFSLFIPLAWGLMTSLKAPNDFDVYKNILGLPVFDRWNGKSIFGNYVNAWKGMQYQPSGVSYYSIMVRGGVEKVYAWSLTQFGWSVFNKTKIVMNVFDFVLNTLVYALGVAAFTAIPPMLIGYLCARFNFKITAILYGTVIFCITTPIVGNSATLLNFLQRFGLYSKFWAEWIRHGAWTNIWTLYFYAFFKGLSNTYSEAAEIDGASQFGILIRIIIPLAKNILTTIFLMVFVGAWSDYNTPLMYIPTMPTLSYAVFQYTRAGKTDGVYNKVAAVLILVIPILLLFIVAKDKVMGNLTLGGLKE